MFNALLDIRITTAASLRQFVAALLLYVLPLSVQANTYQPLDNIRSGSEHFLRTQLGVSADDQAIQIKAGTLDHRLRLAKCATPLQHSIPQGQRLQGRVAVSVKCIDHQNRWSIFVPVTITQFADVVVTTEAVSRGELLRASQLKLERRPLNLLQHGYLRSIKQAVGQRIKTTLARGQIVSPGQINRPYDIKQGQNVNILAKSTHFSVRIKGKALANGRIGDKIRVKNVSSNKIVEGTVTYNGYVEIGL